MRIALATVSGFATGAPWTSGAAPSACKPSIRGARRRASCEALPVGGDVARVADRDAAARRARAELLEDLERRGLLPLEAERVDGVDERDRMVLGELAHERRAPGRSCRAARSPARRASAPGRACRWRSCPRGRSPRRSARRAPRRRRRDAAVLPVDAQMTACAPSRTAARHRARHPAVLERAGRVERPRASATPPRRRARRPARRRTSGVEPSPSDTTGSSARERQPVAVALDEARRGSATNSSSITRIARGGERTKSSRPISSQRGEEARLEQRVDDHHQARVVAQAASARPT